MELNESGIDAGISFLTWYDEQMKKRKKKPKKPQTYSHTYDALAYGSPHLLLGKPEVHMLNDVLNPKENPDKPMTITDGLKMLDDAIPSLEDKPSVIYPGLTALQALVWVADVIIQCTKQNKTDVFLHPQVASRIRQVATNTIGSGKGPDTTVAAAYHLAHPPPPEIKPVHKPKPYERKFS